MTVAIVAGTRPELIKLAPVARALGPTARWFWTGQHWTGALSAEVRSALGLGRPAWRSVIDLKDEDQWKVGPLLGELERGLRQANVAAVVVAGDTDSVLAGALAGAYLRRPVVHVEAGMRSFEPDLPEERNRRLVSQVATLHCCPTALQRGNLLAEGIHAAACAVTGNPIVDSLQRHRLRRRPGRGVLATIHREASIEAFPPILALLEAVAAERPVTLTGHPRTQRAVAGAGGARRVRVEPPTAYPAFLRRLAAAWAVITDSGGVQEEALTMGIPCITLRTATERPETVLWHGNVVVDPWRIDGGFLVELVASLEPARPQAVLGDGHAGERIATLIRGRGWQ